MDRDEWLKMWSAIKRIENTIGQLALGRVNLTAHVRKYLMEDITLIKSKITDTIGQME